jgi:endonuclease/exonuclease/phosphatase family metal-dependent hydrolase
MVHVRVLSYNILALHDDEAAVARVIRGCRADVACLQEVPRFLGQWQRRERLAARAGLVPAPGKRQAGLAVMAGPRARVLAGEYHLITRVPGLHLRGLAIAVLEIEGVRLIAASTHLDLEDEPRRAHAGEVIGLLDQARRTYDAPVVLTGDINEEPGGEAWSLLAKAFQDCYAVAPVGEEYTYSAIRPYERIDGVFADPGITVLGCGVPVDPAIAADYAAATDHRPVVADLEL